MDLRRARVAGEKFVPLLRRRCSDRRGEESRCIVDDGVESAEMRNTVGDHAVQRRDVGQIRLHRQHAAGARGVRAICAPTRLAAPVMRTTG